MVFMALCFAIDQIAVDKWLFPLYNSSLVGRDTDNMFFNKIDLFLHPSSIGQDTALSRREEEFDSPWMYHIEIHSV